MLTPEAFDFVLNNELKRAVRSQNFLTLLLVEPTPTDPKRVPQSEVLREVARLVSREVRETDLLSQTTGGQLSIVLLDSDLNNSMQVVDRLVSRFQHYEFHTRSSSKSVQRPPNSRGRRGDPAPCRRNAPGSPAPR